MPQQINLCTPILLTQKRYFSANTMAVSLAVFMSLGGALCGTWVWNLNRASAAFAQSVTTGMREVESLQSAIQVSRAKAAPADPALVAQLEVQRNAVTQRRKLQEALQEGMFRPGWGHSDRLTWVARSIPDPVWITNVQMDGSRFEVTGFTLEPAALNDWVDKLATSPLTRGLKLATVKVEAATVTTGAVPSVAASTGSAPATPVRPMWSFNLVSMEPIAAVALAASAPGGKP